MTPLRKFFYSLAVFAAFIALIQLPFAFAISSVLGNPNNIDKALEEGGVYDNFVSLALDETAQDSQDNTTKEILADQEVKNVIGQSIQADDIQDASKSVLNGFYAWLDGKTEQPEFTIDLTAPTERATQNLGAYAEKRAVDLPPCTAEQMRTINFQEDILSIPCLPLGVTPAQVGQQFAQQASRDVDLLKDPIISSDKLLGESNATDIKNSNLPEVYQSLHNTKWYTLAVAVILLALLIFGRRNRVAGLRVASIVLLVCAGILAFILLAFVLGKGQTQAGGTAAEVATNTALHLLGQLFSTVRWFVLAYLLAGVAAIIISRRAPQPQPIEASKPPIITS